MGFTKDLLMNAVYENILRFYYVKNIVVYLLFYSVIKVEAYLLYLLFGKWGERMKRISLCFVIVIVLTVTIFRIDSVELLKKLTLKDLSISVNQPEVHGEKKQKKEKDIFVRIVLKNPINQTVYHPELSIEAKHLKIYYGKKFSTKKQTDYLKLDTDSKYFKNSSLIKIESDQHLNTRMEADKEKAYCGTFYIYKENSGLVVVNQVNLEDYVAAVVSSEIGTKSPKEALKAQAVSARTYICSMEIKQYKKYNAVADDSTDYQVYNKTEPTKNCIQAANDTKGLVMLYHLKPIKAYYFSTSCGYTTNYRIWGKGKIPYLKGCEVSKKKEHLNVRDETIFDKFICGKGNGYEKKDPYYRWSTYMSSEQIENAVSNYVGVNIGSFEKAEVNERGVGGIASQITIYGSERQVVINNQTQIRRVFSSLYMVLKLNDGSEKSGVLLLPSAFISLKTIYQDRNVSGLMIYGGGFGHGSGMSQNGAIEMAKDGLGYEAILNTFYDKIIIEKYRG